MPEMRDLTIGGDPEFVFIRKGALVAASDIIKDHACGFGCDGHSTIGEIRPGWSNDILDLMSKIESIIYQGNKKLELSSKIDGILSGHFKMGKPIGGHIHMAFPGLCQMDYESVRNNLCSLLDHYMEDCLEDLIAPTNERSIVWNRENSTFMRRDMSNPLYDNICQLSIKAVEALGLDFGAVDVGVRKLGKRAEEVVVFEVNTAPCMNRDTAGRYARRIKDYYERRER